MCLSLFIPEGHKFMAELLERGFEKHPVMAPTFGSFLFSERATWRR
jgi:hypothetical protein